MTLATDFQSLGITGYNGVTFGPSMFSSGTIEPREDESKRTVIYYTAHIRFEWWLDVGDQGAPDPTKPNTTTDAQMETIRSKLMHSGGDFQYAAVGLGMISVNPAPASPAVPVSTAYPNAAKQLDPVWGPHPKRFTWSISNAKAAKCAFEIDVAFVNCPGVLALGKILEYCFTLDYSVLDGYTTRSYKGFLRIPGVRQPNQGRALQDNADAYLDGAVPPTPTGFERIRNDRTLSYDKCRLDFTIADRHYEGTNYPPAQCVKVEASHTVNSPNGPVFQNWSGVFQGTYEYALGVSPSLGFAAFQAWCLDRMETTRDGGGKAIIPTNLTMTEPSVYGRGRGAFRLTYTYTIPTSDLVKTALKASGLWRAVRDEAGNTRDYDTWATSMKNLKVWDPRGYAQLQFKNTDEVILDICAQKTEAVTPPPTGFLNLRLKPPDKPGFFQAPPPKPEDSFLHYDLEFMLAPRHATTELKPLPAAPTPYTPSTIPLSDANGYRPQYQGGNPSVIQIRNQPSVVLTLRGRAIRAGYSITPPQLVSIAGMTPIPAPGQRDYFRTRTAASPFGVPLVYAQWSFSYILPDLGSPGQGITPPQSPLVVGPGNAKKVLG